MGEVIAFEVKQDTYELGLQMAVGAEYLSAFPQSNDYLAEVATLHRIEFNDDRIYVSADSIPGLESVRQQARSEAERILEENRQRLRDGHFDDVPLDVDALGTARKIVEIGNRYGNKSPEFIEARAGLVLDCSRKWAEAFRKNSWEYFGETVQYYDEVTDELYAHGMSVDSMISNGLSPVGEREEADRRVNDYVGLHTNKTILRRPDADQLAAIRVSPCAQWALDAYKKDTKGAHGGYAPEIEKLMIDYDRFDTKAQTIHHDQIGVSGKFITTDVINKAIRIIQGTAEENGLSKTEIHRTTGLVSPDIITAAVDMLKILDKVASEESGRKIFLGEEVDDDHGKDYEQVYLEAEARKEQQRDLSEELACYVERLQAQNIDPALATVMVEKYIQETMLKIAAKDPSQAEVIFNKETASGFFEVQNLRSQGRYQEAILLQAQVEMSAPAASSCGAGSCGLESVSVTSAEGKELLKKLKAETGDDVLKDKERACKCGKKEIVYAYNKKKVNKLCQHCGSFESKATK